ncbi:MAG: hypothetical protein OQK24_14630 [Magnetovibrio sp.]|nr:hypothetical protein [Magnetovibrio sp.]
MQSCDDCPGSTKCTSSHLYPILVRVYDLYASGTHDKFDILFSLDEDDVEAIELCDAQVSRTCWTKAALMAIGEIVGRIADGDVSDDAEQQLYTSIKMARDAFALFPWHLQELVEQAPDLYSLIQEQCGDPLLSNLITKRSFVKACKEIVYAK